MDGTRMLNSRLAQTVRLVPVWLVGFSMIGLIGCGGRYYDGLARAAVAGAVTLDGIPVDGGTISLIPIGSEGSKRASAAIDKGHYEIAESRGPNPGKCRVEIYWLKPTGRKLQNAHKSVDSPTEEVAEAVPAKFNTGTVLQVDVIAGKNHCSFDLKTK
jgi:hypothetical protein